VISISFSSDGRLLASKSTDDTVRLWRTDLWLEIARLSELFSGKVFASLAFHTTLPSVLATLGVGTHGPDTVIRTWDLDLDELLGGELVTESVKYTTAKIVLVGDSGVGKTGLGWRLAHNAYKEHDSTHGQQFWVVGDLGQRRADGTECEAVLWDLAGQPDYRLLHSLFLDDVDLALVLFDPTNRQEPLGGVQFWLKQLKQRQDRLCRTILIGARADRGSATLTNAELAAYCRQQGISGDFMPISAKTGAGLPELIAHIKAQIPWDELTATVTTATFKRIKEYLLKLKEDIERKGVLVDPAELRRRLEASDSAWEFSDAEMLTAVRHLATHGYVTLLRGSRGHDSILLAPDLLANLAASFVLEARRNPRGLGVLEEDRLLRGEYSLPELVGLVEQERDILLDATAVLFLEHNICFRETFNEQTFLVFPSLINEKRPLVEEIATFEDVSYRVVGAVENVYASLVVLLGYTNTFTRTNQWQNQAQYQLGAQEVCGFRQIAPREGEGELVLYYARDTPKHVQLLFQGLFERFLSRRDVAIARYRPVICPKCKKRLARNVVIEQLGEERHFSFCNGCGKKLKLHPADELAALPRHQEEKLAVQQAIAARRTAYEAALVRVKGLRRDRADQEQRPTCFISYAWGLPEHERWVVRLAKDMQNAGINMLLDRWHNPPGSSLTRFTDQIIASEFVIVVGTPELRMKYETQTSDPVVASELLLINTRLRQPTRYGDNVIPLLLAGEPHRAFTPQLLDRVHVNFRDEDFYFVNLFDLIWRLYGLPFDNPLLEELRAAMSP